MVVLNKIASQPIFHKASLTAMFGFHALYQAWITCRKNKRGSRQAQCYESQLLDHLVETTDALTDGSWRPHPFVCFVVQQPKWREIHAAQFQDRVVHHLLIQALTPYYQSVFIDDVYSNISGKGTHKAVERLTHFMRSQHQTYQHNSTHQTRGRAEQREWQQLKRHQQNTPHYLQLDIANFFNSIDKQMLFNLITKRLFIGQKQQNKKSSKSMPGDHLFANDQSTLLSLIWQIIFHPIASSCHYVGRYHHCVPPHKRLYNAGEEKGLPIGNLTSQFFANVYLNELDQFIKHQLKCRHYLRYVDDFILLHQSKAQLFTWKTQITQFLRQRLALELKEPQYCNPINQGADFLGYIIRPHYRLVRTRVVRSFRLKLKIFANKLLTINETEITLSLNDEILTQLQACLASYLGHFCHAHAHNLMGRIFNEFYWLAWLFTLNYVQTKQSNKAMCQIITKWESRALTYRMQCQYFRTHYPHAVILVEKGIKTDRLLPLNRAKTGVPYQVCITQQHKLKTGIYHRQISEIKSRLP